MFRRLFGSSRSKVATNTAHSTPEEPGVDGALHDADSAHPPAVGQLLGRRYELEQVIGRGGTGVVYRARDRVLGHLVAVKVLSLERVETSEDATQGVGDLRSEALAAMRLSHPLIVRVYNYERHDPWEYLVMEFVPGESLDQRRRAREHGRLNLKETVVIGLDVLEALDYAHQQGVVHNDITPKNILVDRHEAFKVCDFGLAHLVDLRVQQEATLLAGTAAYMSPERVQGVPADRRSDLYSLGATLYTLCSGRTPFDIESLDDLKAHLEQPLPRSPHLAPAFDAILRKAMEKDPEARFDDAHEMQDALARLLCRRPQALSGADGVQRQTPAPTIQTVPLSSVPQTQIAMPASKDSALAGSVDPPEPPAGMSSISPRKVDVQGQVFEIPAFYMDRTPVTNRQFAEFVAAKGELPPIWWPGSNPPRAKLDHPVVGVSIGQARRYAEWRGKRLPSTLEWVSVVRGEEGTRRLPWGDTCDRSGCQCPRDKLGDTAPVNAHPNGVSPEGCADLLGNVWEWTAVDPRYAPAEPGYHYVMGGSFRHACMADQGFIPQTTVSEYGEYLYLGFRCARDGGSAP
jgi:serine/threonine-protein kinase